VTTTLAQRAINATDEVALTNGSYHPYVCEPGDYTIVWTVGSRTPTVTLTVEEGESYYVRAQMSVVSFVLFTVSEYHLDLVDPVTGQEEILECGLVE
jgi:hypothetical protein